jgi:hypothetical protein
MSNTEIIREGQKQGKTNAEISADLAAAGYITNLDRDRTGNAWVILDESNQEPITVENGKIVDGSLIDEMYDILIDGKKYHTDKDDTTLIEGPGIPDIQEREKLPDEPDKKVHRERAGQKIIQRTKKGTYLTTYDADGSASLKLIK